MNAVNQEEEMATTAGDAEAEGATAGNAEPAPQPKQPGTIPSVLIPDVPAEEPDPDNASVFVVPPIDSSDLDEAKKITGTVPAEAAKPAAASAPPVSAPDGPPQSKTGVELNKKTFPSPAELKPERKVLPNIPSKVKLEDIQLPSYMKGVFSQPQSNAPKVTPEMERSIREIGIGPQRPAQKNIVSVAADKRTEIDENGLPKIRTYAQDMSQEIRRRGTSLSTIVGAEREREAERKAHIDEQLATARRRLMLLLGAVVLVFIGIGVVAGVIILTKKAPPVAVITSIVPENKKVSIAVGNNELIQNLTKERTAANLTLGEIERLVITNDIGELTAEALLTKLGAPPELARNADRVMVGIHSFDRNQPFIIIETRYYDLAFGAMLAWEPKMAKTLGGFFTPVTATTFPPDLHFTDDVYKNIDIRKSEAAWPILYAFPAENLLVITTNVNTLQEILTRLSIAKTH